MMRDPVSMLLRLLRSFTRSPASAVELVPPGDLPPDADPGLVGAIRAAQAALARDVTHAAGLLARASARRPGDALAHAMHGVFLEHAGETAAAESAFAAARQAEAGKPVEATVAHHFFARGIHHLNAGQLGPAEWCLQLAHRLLPHAAAPLEMLGLTGYLSGDTGAARAHFDRALERASAGERGALEINRLIDTLPQVGLSSAALGDARAWFEAELDRLLGAPPTISDPLAVIHRTPFFLAFQGRDDRSASARIAELFLRSSPGLGYAAPSATARTRRAGDRLSVGFVSGYLGRHSVGILYRDLARLVIEGGRFEALLFAYGDGVDARLQAAAEARGAFVPLGKTLPEARACIEARAPDVLLYTDVGMHPFFYFLAFSRLAPVQALLIGHPCTSGIPAMDYFLSNVFQDGEGAQAHYTERLVRLPQIAVYVERTPHPAEPLSRAALGWREDIRYYVCPMMLQKLHPDFDRALAAILRRDPRGEVVLLADAARPLWQRHLEKRFAHTMPDVAHRVVFRPFAPKHEFVSILLAADCVLDPFHFTGGVTSYVAASLGVPLVTLPGEFLRSRVTAGIYWQAGVTDCIARSPEHFVELALGFAGDRSAREAFRSKIVAAHPALFATRGAVHQLEDWIAAATRA
jgi:predicted O-linked N-acetylglucosamine transferase (SPINDLY family)